MSTQKRIRAVFFDLDDTLIDWSRKTISAGTVSRQHVDNMHSYVKQLGHAVPSREQFYTLFNETVVAAWTEAKKAWTGVNFGKVVKETLKAAQIDISAIDIHDVLLAYDWRPVPGIEPYPEALSVLSTLKKAGYKLGLITNSMQPMWMRDIELRTYGFLPYFDVRVTSGDVGYMKPHPYIYLSALRQIDVEPSEAIFVGDRPGNDIAGANRVGMVSVWMDPPHVDFELNGVKPHFRITQLGELLPIVRSLSQTDKTTYGLQPNRYGRDAKEYE